MLNFDIRPMRSDDWPAIRNIYSEGIATGNATFETETPEWATWDQGHHQDCRLVARDSERILGWAALSPVSARRVYRGVAEVSVYLAARRGVVGWARSFCNRWSSIRSVAEFGPCKRASFRRTFRASHCTSRADSAKLAGGTNSANEAAFGGTCFCLNGAVRLWVFRLISTN
jgi:hypothetical protein